MRCIVGIGNPGRTYEGSRHNCGFLVVDELARRHATGTWQGKWGALACEWPLPVALGGGKALLLKPQVFVNCSGEVVQAVLAFHHLTVGDLLVVVDDLNLPLGHLRLRPDGSAGGHNGLRDIEARIGQIYPRLRLGIGRPAPGIDQVAYVLGRFSAAELVEVQTLVPKAVDCVEAWLGEGLAAASRFNGPLRPEAPESEGGQEPLAGEPRPS
jgi:PTH1 family peptidyl-tRNA hydrolase